MDGGDRKTTFLAGSFFLLYDKMNHDREEEIYEQSNMKVYPDDTLDYAANLIILLRRHERYGRLFYNFRTIKKSTFDK